MDDRALASWTAFEGLRRISSGAPARVAAEARGAMEENPSATLLIFDDESGWQVEVDFRGTAAEVAGRVEASMAPPPDPEPEPSRGPGRPKLGVVAREVTLLPRHWAWLNDQPGGASVALRRVVDEARRANEGRDRARRSREAANRFLTALAGNLPGFEEATRALFAGDRPRFDFRIQPWPADLRDHAKMLAAGSFAEEAEG